MPLTKLKCFTYRCLRRDPACIVLQITQLGKRIAFGIGNKGVETQFIGITIRIINCGTHNSHVER